MSSLKQNSDNQVNKYYKAFLVRFWTDGESNEWRASAQSVQSGEIVRFSSLQALFDFLQAHTSEETRPKNNQAR